MLPPAYVRGHAAVPPPTAERGRLLLLVFEAGQAFLARAQTALERRDLRGFAVDLGRMQDVLCALEAAVDGPDGAAVAADLVALQRQLVGGLALANPERGAALVAEVQRAYDPLVDRYRALVAGLAVR